MDWKVFNIKEAVGNSQKTTATLQGRGGNIQEMCYDLQEKQTEQQL